METTLDRISSTEGRLKITLSEADYKPEVDKKIKQYSKTAHIKGFRPGMVPKEYIQKLHGKSILVDEVINMVSNTVNTYISDNKLRVVGDPMPDNDAASQINWDTQKEFTFEYKLGIASDFTVDLSALPSVTSLEITVSDDKIDETIEDIRKRFGKEVEVEEVEAGDFVFGVLKQESSEFEVKDASIPTDRVKADAQHIFKGLEKNSSVKFDIQSIFENSKDLGFAVGKPQEEAETLSGEFELTVEKINRTVASDIDQELFDKALGQGQASNEEEFRAEINKIISGNYSRESAYALDYQLDKLLIDNISIELPDAFLKDWLFTINEGKFSQEDIEKDFENFAKGLRLDLIRSEIAQNSDIKLEYADILAEVKAEMMNYFGGYTYEGIDEIIDKMARKTLKENKDNAVRKYTDLAFGKKVRAFVKENVKLESKAVSADEFTAIVNELYGV